MSAQQQKSNGETDYPATDSDPPAMSSGLLELLLSTTTDLISLLDTNYNYQVVNEAYLKAYGKKRKDIIGHGVAELLDAEVFEHFIKGYLDRCLRGETVQFERWFQFPALGIRLMTVTCHPHRMADGTISGIMVHARDITSRNRTEQLLKDREYLLTELQRLAKTGSWDWSPLSGAVRWSEEMYRILGLRHEESAASYELFLKAVHPEDRKRVAECIDRSLRENVPYSIEHRVIRPDGVVRFVHSLGEILLNASGSIDRMVATIQDVTSRMDMEISIRESEKRFRTLFTGAPDAAFLADSGTGVIIDANPAASRLMLMQHERIIGLHQTQLHPPRLKQELKDKFVARIKRARTQGVSLPVESVVLRSDGAEVPVEICDQEINLQGRRVIYGIFRDITTRKNAEEFIRNVLETIDEGFLVIDRGYRIISANKAYCNQMGISHDEIIGRKCHVVSHGLPRPCFDEDQACPVKRTFDTGEPHAEIHVHRNSKGEPLNVETKSFPLRDSSGNVTAAIEIINNVTEKKKLEEQLLHSQKMEAVGLLAGGVAHDFNNILSAIIGYGSLIQVKTGDDAQLAHYATEVLAAANRAANLTKSLLAFSRKQIIDPKPLILNDVIGNIEKLLLRIIGEDIEFKTFYTEEKLTVMADRGQMEQVLLNLATNARDAMPEGGMLTIRTESTSLDDAFLRIHGYGKPGPYALVTVADTGIGMNRNTRDRIFEPFFTTKETGKGTGLGLSIVYGIVKQNHGYIDCNSEPGNGAVFNIYLPLILPSSDKIEPAAALSAKKGSETILMAEDDEYLRRLNRSVLEEYGYRVIVARDGEEAVQLFRDNKDAVRLLVLDVIMPKKNGKDAYDEIRKMAPEVKVLFTSGYTADFVSTKGINEPGRYFLPKPASPTALLLKIREVLDAERK
jgi:PAS domain S-box-containing protein